MTNELEQKLIALLEQPKQEYITKDEVAQLFGEPKEKLFSAGILQTVRTGGSFFSITHGNLLVIALGLILAGTLTGFLARFIPFGNFTTIIIGVVLRAIFRTGIGGDFASGVFLAGIVQLINMLLGGIGLKFSEDEATNEGEVSGDEFFGERSVIF